MNDIKVSQIIQRSELAVPASNSHFIEKATRCDADAIFLDLEDAVANDEKEDARELAFDALYKYNWNRHRIGIRINALSTRWALDDLLKFIRPDLPLDYIIIPKLESANDILFVERIFELAEIKFKKKIGILIEGLIETAKGLANVNQIANSSERLFALAFGIGDYSVELETYDIAFGAPNRGYAQRVLGHDELVVPGHQWHYAMAQIINACRAFGKIAVDGPFTDFSDQAGIRESCRQARAMGFDGKWSIHPSQINVINEEFTPTVEKYKWATRTLKEIQQAGEQGKGAFAQEGKLIDAAHVKLAENIIRRYDNAKRSVLKFGGIED